MSTRIAFLKGHGTQNDFVIVPDPENAFDLPPAAVAALCDRRAGIGGDGVLHVVRTAAHPEAKDMADDAEWFMDYRNGDGSVAEMCGNGVRVFARYLQRAGHAGEGTLAVATRGGVKTVEIRPDGDITVGMGRALLPDGDAPRITVRAAGRSWPALHVDMGNPHAVAFLDDSHGLDGLTAPGDLLAPPEVSPGAAYPDGVNVEFAVARGPRHVALRVHERGSGETRSCGTGACAVAVAAARRDGAAPAATGAPVTYTVDLPGGRLTIRELPGGEIEMTGPAVIVAEGALDTEWLARASKS